MNWLMKLMNPLSYSKNIFVNGKTFCIEWTERADIALRERKRPLNIEMELYFSCMVKKLVRFHDSYSNPHSQDTLHNATDKMGFWFHPVTSLSCEISDAPIRQPTIDIDVHNLHNYYPKRLKIDYRKGHWEGKFF